MLVTNPVTNDPRVRREAATLVKAGYEAVIIGVRTDDCAAPEELDGYEVIRIVHPRILGKRLARCLKIIIGVYAVLKGNGKQQAEPSQNAHEPLSQSFLTKLSGDILTIISMVWLNVALCRKAIRQQADSYHSHDLDTLLAGVLAKFLTKKPLVYDFHELYTEQFKEGQKTWIWHTYYSMLERVLVKYADVKLTVCDSLGEWITERYGATGSVTIMNAPPYQVAMRHPRKVAEKVVLYQGLYFPYRGLEQIIESARYMKRGRIILRGYGYWEPHLRSLVEHWKLQDRVEFAEPVPMTELVHVASEADVGVAPFLPVCLNTRFCLPNKLFEYMMAGLVIAGSNLPEMRRIIVEHDLGVVFNPERPEEIAKVLNDLLADEARLERAKRQARYWAKTRYNWEVESQKLLDVYGSLFRRYRSRTNTSRQHSRMADRQSASRPVCQSS